MTTNTCESFEVIIERQAHGAVSSEEHAALAAHLETCASCRAYAENAALADRMLGAMAERARADVDWSAVETRIHGAIAQRLRRFFVLAGLGIAAVVLVGFMAGGAVNPSSVGIVGAILAVRLVMVFAENRALQLAKGQELFAAHRVALATRIRAMRGLRWIALAIVGGLLGIAWLSPDLPIRERLTFTMVALFVGGVWGHNIVVELPRLERELTTLGSPSK